MDDVTVNLVPYYGEENNLSKNAINYVRGTVMNVERSKSATVSAHFHGSGYAMKGDGDGTTCNIDATDCYNARIVPSIYNISESGGWSSGGQMITITGQSLDANQKINVTVDDVPCLLQDYNATSIKC